MKKLFVILSAVVLAAGTSPLLAQEKLKLGFIVALSGALGLPGAAGIVDQRTDGSLYIKLTGTIQDVRPDNFAAKCPMK